jgi:hypothetical protein
VDENKTIKAEKIINGRKYSTQTAELIYDKATSLWSHVWYFRKKQGEMSGELFSINEFWEMAAAIRTGRDEKHLREEQSCLEWQTNQGQIYLELEGILTTAEYEKIFGAVEE